MNLDSAQSAPASVERAPLPRRALRLALLWQVGATALISAAAGALAGLHGAASALLGGAICTIAFATGGWLATRRAADSATSMVTTALMAEMVKVGIIVVALGLSLFLYRDVIAPALLSSFITSVVILALAIFIRDTDRSDSTDSGAHHGHR